MEDDGAPAPRAKMPASRSGPKVLVIVLAGLLLFITGLWYASFVALQNRGPDRAFVDKESWNNETLVLVVTDIDEKGVVPISSLTASIVSSSGQTLFNGTLSHPQATSNFTLDVRFADRDASGSLTKGDALLLVADPPSARDVLILSNFYLYAAGQEWARFQIN